MANDALPPRRFVQNNFMEYEKFIKGLIDYSKNNAFDTL